MKKKTMLKICMIITVCALLVIGGIVASAQTSVDYYKTGKHTVSIEKSSDYWIFYPKDIADMDTVPMITWGNGTAMKTSTYKKLLTHIASHGFIIAASTSTMTGDSVDMIGAIDYMDAQNQDSNSKFYGKVDINNIAAVGHSQGGKGAVKAACNDSRIKCIIPIQGSIEKKDAANVTCPMFLITAERDYIVYSNIYVMPAYEASNVPTVYASLNNSTHTAPMFYPEKMQGYITAWLYAYLKNDDVAMSYFAGEMYSLQYDKEWSDVQHKNFE